ncbi:3360_t:CDS:2, partial [Racocetra fulgida]
MIEDNQIVKAVEVILAVVSKLIPALIKNLPAYKQHSGVIERILKQRYKMQKRTVQINAAPELQMHNHIRMG